MRMLTFLFIFTVIASLGRETEAGVGSLIRKGANTVSRKVLGKGAARAGGKAAGKAARSMTRAATTRGATAAANASNRVLSHLGAPGAVVMSKLPAASQKRLAEISVDLARSPHRGQWLKLLSQHGDQCLDFLWRNKRGLAVGAAAGAVLLKPGDFLSSLGGVAEAGISATGEFVAKPVVTAATDHVVGPVAAGAVRTFPWHKFWNFVFITLFVIGAARFYRRR